MVNVLFLLHREAADHNGQKIVENPGAVVALRDNFEILRIGL